MMVDGSPELTSEDEIHTGGGQGASISAAPIRYII